MNHFRGYPAACLAGSALAAGAAVFAAGGLGCLAGARQAAIAGSALAECLDQVALDRSGFAPVSVPRIVGLFDSWSVDGLLGVLPRFGVCSRVAVPSQPQPIAFGRYQ